MQNSPILVTGAHRSGSTWVGQVLASAPETGYLHEPFNPIYPTPPASPIDKWFLYIERHNEAQYRDFLRDTLHWKYRAFERLKGVKSIDEAKLWLKYAFVHRRNRGKRMVFKDPIALFSTEWLVNELGMLPVILVRHPGAFAYSLKRKGWGFPFDHFLEQPELMDQHLAPFRTEIERFTKEQQPILEQACLLWRVMYHFVDGMQKQYHGWSVLKHEDLSANPEQEFSALFTKLGLEFNSSVVAFIRQSSGQGNATGTVGEEENLKRDSKANIDYWKEKLTADELKLVQKKTQDIWPVFYDENTW